MNQVVYFILLQETHSMCTTNDYLSQLSKEEQAFINESFLKYPNVDSDLKATLAQSFIARNVREHLMLTMPTNWHFQI